MILFPAIDIYGGKAVRLAFKDPGGELSRDEKFKLFHDLPAQDMFDVTVI